MYVGPVYIRHSVAYPERKGKVKTGAVVLIIIVHQSCKGTNFILSDMAL